MDATLVESWLKDHEKALLFGIGAYLRGEGQLLEIGSWHGSSACYLAGGVMRRGYGRLTCVDPHLGGPPWLGLRPDRGTYSRFSEVTQAVGVAGMIDVRVGESTAVAAVWPAAALDAVFIDGDHSFTGALKDFECWAPQVRPGGLVLVDDADDPALPELRELIELLKGSEGVSYLETVDGFAVFRRDDVAPWTLLECLRDRSVPHGVHRAWNMSVLHQIPLPTNFLLSRTWDDGMLDTAYELCFLARCGPGPYAYTSGSYDGDRALLHALSADRHDGEVIPVEAEPSSCRAILCRPEEAAQFAPLLQPGGILIARDTADGDHGRALAVHGLLIQAGLDGSGWSETTHWGVWRPHRLSADATFEFAAAACVEPEAT